jgi:hypothetical protein
VELGTSIAALMKSLQSAVAEASSAAFLSMILHRKIRR